MSTAGCSIAVQPWMYRCGNYFGGRVPLSGQQVHVTARNEVRFYRSEARCKIINVRSDRHTCTPTAIGLCSPHPTSAERLAEFKYFRGRTSAKSRCPASLANTKLCRGCGSNGASSAPSQCGIIKNAPTRSGGQACFFELTAVVELRHSGCRSVDIFPL